VTIRKGQPWGEPAVCPADLQVLAGDGELGDWVTRHRRDGGPLPEVGLAAGDLARTCGGSRSGQPSAAKVTVDVMRVVFDDGEPTWGVAHVVARRSWTRGEVQMVMNAQYFGGYDVVPRSHPNDGKLDVLRVDPAMSYRERVQARRRARTGAHLPHPRLSVRSLRQVDLAFSRPMPIWIDGVRRGTARRLQVIVEPDALTVYV